MFDWLKKKEKTKIYSYYGTLTISLTNGSYFYYTIEPIDKSKSKDEQIDSMNKQWKKIVEIIDDAKSKNIKFETNPNEYIYADKVASFKFTMNSAWRYDEN